MRRPIRPFVGLGELIEIDRVHLLAVEHNLDTRAAAGDLDVIPFAHGPHGIARWFREIVSAPVST
jgi:hypothetical protein